MIIETLKDARAALKSVLGEESGLVQKLEAAIHDYIKLDNAIAVVLENAQTVRDPRVAPDDPRHEPDYHPPPDVEIVDSDLLDNLLKASGR